MLFMLNMDGKWVDLTCTHPRKGQVMQLVAKIGNINSKQWHATLDCRVKSLSGQRFLVVHVVPALQISLEMAVFSPTGIIFL